MANRVGTGGELAYRSPLHHAGSAAQSVSDRSPFEVAETANESVVVRTSKVSKGSAAAAESPAKPRRLAQRVTTLLTDQEDGLTVPELCDRLTETSDAIRAALATLLLSGRVRRLGARRHTRYVLNG